MDAPAPLAGVFEEGLVDPGDAALLVHQGCGLGQGLTEAAGIEGVDVHLDA